MNSSTRRLVWLTLAVVIVAAGLLNLTTGSSVGGVLLPVVAAMFAVSVLQRLDLSGRRRG